MNLSLSSVLLFALLVPFIMTYRIGPDQTPFWLFGLIFLGLLLYVFLDIIKIDKNKYFTFKTAVLWFCIFASIGSGFVSAIIVRHETHPIYQIHDIILQLEAAIRFFLDGVNPYSTSYFGTFLEQWNYSEMEINPALYHFVMQPFYLIFSIPFYVISNRTIGYFDGRIPLFILFLVMLILANKIPKEKENKLLFVTLLAFNPAMLPYILEGRSDVFMFSFAFGGFYMLQKGKDFLAGVLLALAFAVKQSIWPLYPFYLGYLYFKTKSIKKSVIQMLPFFATFLLFVLPFYFWDPKAFLESTVFYLSGSAENSYPISGYGFGAMLVQMGLIANKFAQFPFILFQVVICLPLLFFLLKIQKSKNSVKSMIILYAVFLFVYWYLSRYFNNSHLGYISMILIAGYFWPAGNSKNDEKLS